MLDFLKQLFNKKERDLTFVLFDDREPDPSTSYRFKPVKIFYLIGGMLLTVAVGVFLLLKFTPIAGLFFSQTEKELRTQAIEIAQQVQMLQDSLEVRNEQLLQLKEVIAEGQDTVFAVNQPRSEAEITENEKSSELSNFSRVHTMQDTLLAKNEIVLSDIFENKPEFPVGYPLEGTITREYDPGKGHFGIDIATREGSTFTAIADGAVINQSWTLNYGWVLYLQHSNDIVTVYKHAASVSKSIGDIVLKGDVLGTAGNVGIISSGPHLHIEIWKNGVPQNPNSYLINL